MPGRGAASAVETPAAVVVAVIGAGLAGLMAAEMLAAAGQRVDVFDGMLSVERKFLLVAVGRLNFGRSENFDAFVSRCGRHSLASRIEVNRHRIG